MLSTCRIIRGSLIRVRGVPTSWRRPIPVVVPACHTVAHRCFSAEDGTPSSSTDDKVVVYESPLSRIVTRLRTVSLLSALTGSVGLPVFCAVRGIENLPSTGILAFGMTFAAGSMASTAAIHYVFSPYIYEIVKIPVRQCQGQAKDDWQEPGKYMLQAVSRSLILTRVETTFNPLSDDVLPYKGLRPLCNLLIHDKPLYVHPEFVQSATLRKQLHLKDPEEFVEQVSKENPDDFL